MASKLKHENIVNLLGYYVDHNIRILAYEYATKKSLYELLHGTNVSITYFHVILVGHKSFIEYYIFP